MKERLPYQEEPDEEPKRAVDIEEFCSKYCTEIERVLDLYMEHDFPITFTEEAWTIDKDEYMEWLSDPKHEEAINAIHGFVLRYWD